MKHYYLGLSASVFAMLSIVGCTNDNYDLSDIDSTTRINVTDLVLPINIDPVKIGDVLEFEGDSKIQPVTIDGKEFYALVENGDFSSESIDIPSVKAPAVQLNPTHAEISIQVPDLPMRTRGIDVEVSAKIENVGDDFCYSATNIDESIVRVDYVEIKPLKFNMYLNFNIDGVSIEKLTYKNVVIRAPKGLTCEASVGEYDKQTGVWSIPELTVNANKTDISLYATGVDAKLAGAEIKSDHSLDFEGELIIENADVSVNAELNDIPSHAELTIEYGLDDFEVVAFSGRVGYKISGIDIPSVSLGDIPDFLQGDKNNISLANPQIYVNVNNPVADTHVSFETGVLIEAVRGGYQNIEFRPNEKIVISDNYGSGPYNFLLGVDYDKRNVPTEPVDYNTNLDFIEFPTLGDLLTTPSDYPVKGLPESINIALENTCIPEQDVVNFRLEPIDGVVGHYSVVCPLALNDGSYIVYSDSSDGWNENGDLDDLTITKLELSADVVNNCPVDLDLTAYPIDRNGNRIEGVKFSSKKIQANASSELQILLEGNITGMDGVDFEAVLTGGKSEDALSPSQTLDLSNIRIKVSGYYTTEF